LNLFFAVGGDHKEHEIREGVSAPVARDICNSRNQLEPTRWCGISWNHIEKGIGKLMVLIRNQEKLTIVAIHYQFILTENRRSNATWLLFEIYWIIR